MIGSHGFNVAPLKAIGEQHEKRYLPVLMTDDQRKGFLLGSFIWIVSFVLGSALGIFFVAVCIVHGFYPF